MAKRTKVSEGESVESYKWFRSGKRASLEKKSSKSAARNPEPTDNIFKKRAQDEPRNHQEQAGCTTVMSLQSPHLPCFPITPEASLEEINSLK